MKIQLARGVRDTNPEEKILKNKIESVLRKNFELNGFNPLQTPVIERLDVLSSKYAGGEEILKEIFQFNDQGERNLCLRYDLTVPFARYIAMNPTLKMPFKRYQIGQVFRDGPIKLGRYREFSQCDVDVVGIKDVFAEAEMLKIAKDSFQELELDCIIDVNNRKILDAIMQEVGIKENKILDVILTVDKIKKLSKKDIYNELENKGIDSETSDKLFELLEPKNNNDETLSFLKETLKSDISKEAIIEMETLLNYLKLLNTQVIFNPSLARGLAYYTGTVFEVFMKESAIKSSIAAGGRYDEMIGKFVANNQEYPAVGISFGLDVIFEVMKLENEKAKKVLKKSVVKAYIVPIGTKDECIKLLNELRNKGIETEINLTKKGISKALDYASYYKIPYAILVGENELKENKFTLRNMISGVEKKLSKSDLIKELIKN